MALRYSTYLCNAGIDARIRAVGSNPVLKIYSDADEELISMQLPANWMGKAEDGSATSTGPWTGMATAEGKATSFRIYDKAGKACHIDGIIPGDLKPNNASLAIGQGVTIATFTIRSGNAGSG